MQRLYASNMTTSYGDQDFTVCVCVCVCGGGGGGACNDVMEVRPLHFPKINDSAFNKIYIFSSFLLGFKVFDRNTWIRLFCYNSVP